MIRLVKVGIFVFAVAMLMAPSASAQVCQVGEVCVTDLFGGQTIDAGDVTISNTEDDLVIQIDGQNGWVFDVIHVYVGTDPVPTNGGGNVRPGKFPYKFELPLETDNYTVVVPLSNVGVECDDTVNIVVHTELFQPDFGQEETGFAFGDEPFTGKRWGWSLLYTISCEDVEPPPEI